MAVKAAQVSDVPHLDQVPDDAELALCSSPAFTGSHGGVCELGRKKLAVIGHRGCGMNMLQSSDRRMKAIKENSILSFNAAGKFPLDLIEFDVQVTKDDCPVIYHDIFVLTEEKGMIIEKRVTDLISTEFLSYGTQRDPKTVGKPLFRKTKDGRIFEWKVEKDDAFCTLQEVFQKVDHSLGFNIELKFDDNTIYREEDVVHILQVVLQVVFQYAKDRHIIFSSFQPDAARLIRKLQATYPVFFLTNGGLQIYADNRRNSLDEAMKLCLENSLQGIVSEVKAILRNPGAIVKIRKSNLSLITYGQLNNVPEVVLIQNVMGVEGVIVDLVQEITEAVSDFLRPVNEQGEVEKLLQETGKLKGKAIPHLPEQELSFLLEFMPILFQSSAQ
ncbi:Glycerophosphodiester phosphodiesterase [Bertholletia excelsa]